MTQLEKGAAVDMKHMTFGMVILLAVLSSGAIHGESKYPPIGEYLLSRDAEIALAKTAAPANVSDRATIKILTKSGYEVGREGDNGVVCMVMRGFSAPTYTSAAFRDLVYAPTIHAPICFTPPAARTALPYYELRTRLAMAGMSPDQIARALEDKIAPQGVGVIIEARHLCMQMRGVEKQHGQAVTSAMLGAFRENKQTRDEFLALVGKMS